MKIFPILVLTLFLSSCNRSSNETWEGVKTAGRYLHKGFNSLLGKDVESKLLASQDDFIGPNSEDFIPLNDKDLQMRLAKSDIAIPQPKRFPGEKGSNLPGFDHFRDPSSDLIGIFSHLHFETDDHILKDKESVLAISKIAAYMKAHPQLHVVIEGHCDERASADYNMALGMRRAQYVRVLLSKQGINPNRLYTISRGKEKPLASGHGSEDWRVNRRAQFKLYESIR